MKQISSHWSTMLELCRHAQDTLREQRWVIVGAFCVLLLETLLRLAEPWPLQYLVDNFLLPLGANSTAAEPNSALPMPWLAAALACVALVVIVSARALTAYGWTIGFAMAGNRLLLAIRAKVFAHLQTLSLSFHGNARGGDLLTRLIDDVAMVRDVVISAAMPLAGSVVLLVAMMGVMAWMNWRLTLIVLCGFPILWLVARRKKAKIFQAAKNQRRQVSQIAATAAEALSSIKAVQALGLSDQLNAQFDSANGADLQSGVKVKRLSANLERTVDVVLGAMTAVTLFAGLYEVAAVRLSPGELLVFLAYLRSCAKPIRNWAKYTARIAKSTAGARRILELLNTTPGVVEIPDPVRLERAIGRIQFDQVDFAHENAQPLLREASLIIAPGETVALVGTSGTGKSTVLSLLMRLMDPDQGCVRVDGIDIRSLAIADLRQQFSVALQDPLLFHGSVKDNIAQSNASATVEQIDRAAAAALVTSFTDRWSKGLDTPIEEQGANLSNGQRQRISLARAILKNAPIIVVDEPLTALDPATSRAVSRALTDICANRTTLIATHDTEQALRADRLITIRDGGFVELDPVEFALQTNQELPVPGNGARAGEKDRG